MKHAKAAADQSLSAKDVQEFLLTEALAKAADAKTFADRLFTVFNTTELTVRAWLPACCSADSFALCWQYSDLIWAFCLHKDEVQKLQHLIPSGVKI